MKFYYRELTENQVKDFIKQESLDSWTEKVKEPILVINLENIGPCFCDKSELEKIIYADYLATSYYKDSHRILSGYDYFIGCVDLLDIKTYCFFFDTEFFDITEKGDIKLTDLDLYIDINKYRVKDEVEKIKQKLKEENIDLTKEDDDF